MEGSLICTVSARIDGTAQRIGFAATQADDGFIALADFHFEILNLTPAASSTGGEYQTIYAVEILALKNTSWTNGKFKVLDADGNLIYWVSTQ